jgi:energy-coupling factor transporter ATP-binding protein EcfA2
MTETNPFTPGLPATSDLFVGRDAEIQELVGHVKAATSGRLQVAFLAGERGIGKSSLAAHVRGIAEREHGMAGAHVFLGGVDSLQEMTRRIFDHLLKESVEKKWHEKVKDLFGSNIEKITLFGLGFQLKASADELDALLRGFATAIRKLTERLRADKDKGHTGVFLVLDDLDTLADLPDFANWLKSTIDEISVNPNATPLCLLLVGLEDRRQAIVGHQPSLARAFHLFPIEPWGRLEAGRFFVETFGRVNVKVTTPALDALVTYAGGLPVLAHELGEAALKVSRTDPSVVTEEDAYGAILRAARIVGQKHLQPQVLEAIRSALYRNTLETIAYKVPLEAQTFHKSDIKPELSPEESRNFHNFLARMSKLGVLLPVDRNGTYRFSTVLHHVYLWMLASDKRKAPPVTEGS